MKKLSILLLALAIAAFAVPAMAGEVSMDGEYTLGGDSYSEPSDDATFSHELDLNINVTSGDVKFHWDVELADGSFDDNMPAGDANGIWDGFYVQWQAMDMLKFKAGIFGVSDGSTLMFYSAGNGDGNMGIMLDLEMVDLGFYLSKQDDNAEDDQTEMLMTAKGEFGPVAASLMYGQRTIDDTAADDDESALYLDAKFDAGPVAVMIAYGSASTDDGTGDGGTIMILEAGLEELIGFDLTLTMIQTNEDWVENGAGFGNDYGYAKELDYDADADQMMVGLTAGYDINDKLSVSGLIVAMNDVDGDDGPVEMDVTFGYSFADNVNYEIGYATVSGNDTGTDTDRLWHEIVFEF